MNNKGHFYVAPRGRSATTGCHFMLIGMLLLSAWAAVGRAASGWNVAAATRLAQEFLDSNDSDKPVTIVVDGETRFADRVAPSLATALQSYERRHDWGLIYPIKIEIDCTADAEE